ncbi:MAG: hypothetical protein RLZZ436_1698 [Planctomycetota bacterium]
MWSVNQGRRQGVNAEWNRCPLNWMGVTRTRYPPAPTLRLKGAAFATIMSGRAEAPGCDSAPWCPALPRRPPP